MDCYSLNSDVAETLNYLRPPVQRDTGNISTDPTYTSDCSRHHNYAHLMKDCRTKLPKCIQHPIVDKTSGTSSTSLVLKKITEKEIFEQYSVLSYTDLQRTKQNFGQKAAHIDRPLIKVTVIPNNTAQTQTAKLRKRRNATKRIQSTVSNQENSIKAKNVYLVVAGRKREKIYEIKTTGSAEFVNSVYVKDDHEGAEQVTDFKHLISSLNMDKKKKKGKKKEAQTPASRSSLVNEVLQAADIPTPNDDPNDIRPRKSRVRITGRIGLTEDDRYVLRCDATVDDKPIPTTFTPLQQGVFINNNQKSRNSRNFKDSNIQADFELENVFNASVQAKLRGKDVQGKETQATQTNLNSVCFSNIETLKIFSQNDQTICTCKKANKDSKTMSEMESKFDSPNTSSPLVIISVYPKQETLETNKNEKNPVKDNRNRSPQRVSPKNSKPRAGKQPVENNLNKNENKSPRTHSPSPGRSSPKSRFENNQMETRTLKAKITKESNQGNLNFNKPQNSKDKINQDPRTKSSKLSSLQTRPASNKKQQNGTTSKPQDDKGTNTDHLLTKKALVDTYTKKISDHMNQNRANSGWAKSDVSNVAINVESANEFYDFLFHHGDLTTDMRFRKTVKDQASQKEHNVTENMSPSLENFLLLTENAGARKRSFSQTFLFDQPSYDDIGKLKKPLSRVNVRDSIEISHRREQRNSLGPGTMDPDSNTSVNSNEYFSEEYYKNFAPIKHYRGDSCSILDPVQRDKEIRELLGVNKPRPTMSKPEVSHETFLVEENSSLHCFYQVNKHQSSPPVKGSGSICSLYECTMHECLCEEQTDTNQKLITPRQPTKLEETTPDTSDETPPPTDSKESEVYPEDKPPGLIQTASPLVQPQHPLYQQLILNRNINVYLQIEQFTKQKPIVLSRKQYDKVKRTIESASAKTAKRPCIWKKYSSISIGEVRRKTNNNKKGAAPKRETRQDKIDEKPESKSTERKKKKKNKNLICQCGDGRTKVICKCGKDKHIICDSRCIDKDADHSPAEFHHKTMNPILKENAHCPYCGQVQSESNNYCCFCGMKTVNKPGKGRPCRCTKRSIKGNSSPRQASSSVEIRYTSVAYMKHVTFSSTAIETSNPITVTDEYNVHNTDSIFTIFKGRRKSPTPNLGTSVYSLYSNYTAADSPKILTPDPKPRRPFLRRLMSCLVMRSTKESLPKVNKRAVPNLVSINSSIDSYHISTSLGAIELSSSIYDTSDSFYSNHSIMPINKMKRSFLSSVRGFLTSRRS